jgi:anti-sigma factor RsiW
MPLHEDDRVDAVLRASRPEPDGEFTRRLERRLLGADRVREPRRSLLPLRPALAGAGAAGLLATAALIASLAGAGPLAGSDGGARAREDCRYVTVHRPGKVPVVVSTKEGGTRIAYRPGTVTKRVKRCR